MLFEDNEFKDILQALDESWSKVSQVMFECSDIEAKEFAQDCCDGIETLISDCKRKGHITSLKSKSSKQIKDGDKITPEMAKKFTGWINDFQPINTTFSYDLRRMVIEKGIGVSFTPDPTSAYEFIIDPNRFDEWLQLAKRFCVNIDTEFIKKRLNSKDTNQFVGCRIYL